MNDWLRAGLELAIYLTVIFFVFSLSFEMGEYQGLTTFCKADLMRDIHTGEYTCVSKGNTSVLNLWDGSEVILYD